MWFDKDGILISVYKEHAVLTRQSLCRSFTMIKARAGGQKVYWLGEVTHSSYPDKEARDYAAAETPGFIAALALITNSAFSRMMVNTYLVLKAPPFPTRLFTNRDQAREWLLMLKNKAKKVA